MIIIHRKRFNLIFNSIVNETTAETLCINVLAAFIGLSYPIFLQIITTLDAKYDSVMIMRRFREESAFKCFSIAVVVMFVVMVYVPFAPPAPVGFDCFIIVHSARIIAIGWLVLTFLSLIWMVKVTLEYFEPIKLLQRIAGKSEELYNDKERYGIFLDILKFSMKAENLQLFLNCNTTYGGCIGLCRKNAEDSFKKNPTNTEIETLCVHYPDYIYNTVSEITRLSIKIKSINPYIANPVNFIVSLFEGSYNSLLSKETFFNLWANSLSIAKNGDKDWILDYWTYALQMVEYNMDNRAFNYSLTDNLRHRYEIERQYFIDQHYVFGAYLLYKNRKDILEEIFSLKISSFSRTTLIPDTLEKAIGFIKRIESSPQGIFALVQSFPFFETKGVGDADFIEGCCFRYFLYCLLSKSDDLDNEASGNIFAHSSSESTDKEIIDRMRQILYDNLIYFESLGFKRLRLTHQVDEKLKALSEDIDTRIKEEIDSQRITEIDISQLNGTCKGLFMETISHFPASDTDTSDWQKVPLQFVSNCEISKEVLYLFKENTLKSLPSNINSAFAQYLTKRYAGQLFSPIKTFNVDFSEIGKALDQLATSQDYAIIGVGGIDSDTDSRVQYRLPSGDASIYIMKQHQLITVNNDIKSDVKVDTLNESSYMLTFKCNIAICIPPILRFIRLRIINSLYDGRESQLSHISQISKIMP